MMVCVPDGPGDSSALVHSHFVDIYLVRQDAAALLSSQKEHEQLFWHCVNSYRGVCAGVLCPAFWASNNEAKLYRLRNPSQERLSKLSLWRCLLGVM